MPAQAGISIINFIPDSQSPWRPGLGIFFFVSTRQILRPDATKWICKQ